MDNIFERKCYSFINKDREKFKNLLQNKIVNFEFKSGRVEIVDFGFKDDYVTQGVDKKDIWIELSNKTIKTYDIKFDKNGQNTNRCFFPYVSEPQEGKIGWAIDEGRKILYMIMETENKSNDKYAIPINIIDLFPIEVSKEFIYYFPKNHIYPKKSVGYEKANRKNGKYNDSLGRVPWIKDVKNYIYNDIKPKVKNPKKQKQSYFDKPDINEWV